MKKKIFALAVVLICVSILASTTLAYFTDMGTARNVITSGGIGIEVVEEQLVDGIRQPYPSQPIRIMPGTEVSKIVSVNSLGQKAWIRVSYTVTALDPNGEEMDVPAEELAAIIMIQPDAENWTLRDGWWYYIEALRAGEGTTPLFEQVAFAGPQMGNQYQGCTVIIDVTAQAVQQANNGDSALDAAGWPET